MRRDLGAFAFLALVLGLVYFPALGGPYLSWDDQQHFTLNPWLQAGDWRHFWLAPHYGLYIPVTYTLWTWVHSISTSPFLPHAMNLGLHLVNCALVHALARREIGERAAWVAALGFALHPLQVEAVAWISGGRDVLAAFFALAALCLGIRRRALSDAIAVVLFALSLLAKPSAVALPLAAVFLAARPRFRLLAAWSGLALAAAVISIALQSDWARSRLPETLGLWQKVAVASDAAGFYLRFWLWPYPLAADYGRTPAVILAAGDWVWGLLLLLAAIVAASLWLRREAVRGLLFAVALLLPVLGFVPFSAQAVSTVFDRYMYLPMAGMALALAACTPWRWVLPLAVLWSALSWQRAAVWGSDRALAADMLEKNPTSYDGANNMGLSEMERGNRAAAGVLFEKARAAEPRRAVAWANLAYLHWVEADIAFIENEIHPLVASAEFVNFNANEAQALSLLFRMSARAHARLGRTRKARDAYCRAQALNGSDLDLSGEVRAFFRESGLAGSC